MDPMQNLINTGKALGTPGSRIAHHDSGTVDRDWNIVTGLAHDTLGFEFGPLVAIEELLSAVQLALRNATGAAAGNVCRGDVMQPAGCAGPPRRACELRHVAGSADIVPF